MKIVYTSIRHAYQKMFEENGNLQWWPADGPLEICIGAILTQNTSWKNVEKALNNLRANSLLEDASALNKLSDSEIEKLIQPSGYFRLKTKRLKNLLNDILDRSGGCVESYLSGPTNQIRSKLLEINGIGPETADSILLYAGDHPVFVVDAYTKRIFSRHKWAPASIEYHQLQEICHKATENYLPNIAGSRVDYYKDFHAQIVVIGNEFCRPKNPNCNQCPLNCLL